MAYNPVAPDGHVWQDEVAVVGKPVSDCTGFLDGTAVVGKLVAGCTGFPDGAFVFGRSRQLPFWQHAPQ